MSFTMDGVRIHILHRMCLTSSVHTLAGVNIYTLIVLEGGYLNQMVGHSTFITSNISYILNITHVGWSKNLSLSEICMQRNKHRGKAQRPLPKATYYPPNSRELLAPKYSMCASTSSKRSNTRDDNTDSM